MNPKQPQKISVVVAPAAALVEQFAAGELRRYLHAATGRPVPLLNELPARGLKCLVGGVAARFLPDYEANRAKLKHDGFILHFAGDKILILGNNPRGTLNGVYAFLHALGFCWVFPGKDGEIIPCLSDLPVEAGTRIVNPDLEFRGVYIYPVDQDNVENLRKIIDWMGKNRINMLMTSILYRENRKLGWAGDWEKVSDQLLPEVQKRGIVLDLSGHSGRYFFPVSYFKKHPEWFAMNSEGKRFSSGQLCYSNTEAVSVLSENYAKYVMAHPEVDIIGTWPEDGYGFCQCAKCRKPGAVLRAVNKIAERIEQVRPDLTVEYLSYTKETSAVPPEILPRRNIAILVANPGVAGEWLEKSKRAGGRGVYQLHYHIADNTAERASLPLRFEKTRQDCRKAKALGLRGIIPFYIGIDTWWRSSLNLYFLSRFSWDTKQSAEDILHDFCRKYYPAVKAMPALFKALEKMPMVSQHTPPPWPLWQNWPDIKRDYTGAKWQATLAAFAGLYAALADVRQQAVPAKRFDVIKAFLDSSRTMFYAWHARACAVMAFENNDAASVREHIIKTAEYEQQLVKLYKSNDGVNGAWPDYFFFQNWRLQLDKQLLEMRASGQKKPVIDENPEVATFLPALLGL